MQLFKINKDITISGEVYSNSKAWGHEVKLFKYGYEREKARIRYYNRTWERYQFETAFYELLDKAIKSKQLDPKEAKKVEKFIKEYR